MQRVAASAALPCSAPRGAEISAPAEVDGEDDREDNEGPPRRVDLVRRRRRRAQDRLTGDQPVTSTGRSPRPARRGARPSRARIGVGRSAGRTATRSARSVSIAATRSVPECAASATKPSDPVMSPVDELQRRRARRGDDREPRQSRWGREPVRLRLIAEPHLCRGRGRQRVAIHASSARAARPRWLIASFSAARARPSCGPSCVVVGHERRVVAEAARRRAARPPACPCSGPRTTCSAPSLGSTYASAQTYASALPAGASRSSLARFSSSVASSPGVAGRAHARARRRARPPRSRSRRRSRPRRSPRRLRAPCRARCRRTCRRPRAAARRSSGSGSSACGASSRANSRTLVRVAAWRGRASRRACAAIAAVLDRAQLARCPAAASASSSSRCARESGVRSAVAWTSTSPPSPVMTTFASTSAVESSG